MILLTATKNGRTVTEHCVTMSLARKWLQAFRANGWTLIDNGGMNV